MLTFRLRSFLILLAYTTFALIYISVGIRWHVYRARASLYAKQELEHTFEAAKLLRAARNPGPTDEDQERAKRYRILAKMHEKAALENTRLREIYERSW